MAETVLTAQLVRAGRRLGPETARNQARRMAEGFYQRYLSGDAVLDIGFRGGVPDAEPITAKAVGVELDYPGYDGIRLPFPDQSQDAVFASHTLEHIVDWRAVLADWYRVLKIGGYLVVAVPHQFLYERKANLPSRFNGDHKRFYTPASLMAQIEEALPLAGWRLRSLRDVDEGFSYDVPPEQSPVGCYEIEMVVQRIAIPSYAGRLVAVPAADRIIEVFAEVVTRLARGCGEEGQGRSAEEMQLLLSLPLPPFQRLRPLIPHDVPMEAIRAVLRPLIENAPFDEEFYVLKYKDIKDAVAAGRAASGRVHYVHDGYFNNRMSQPDSTVFD
jgi:SAM-dependent methyltransferase